MIRELPLPNINFRQSLRQRIKEADHPAEPTYYFHILVFASDPPYERDTPAAQLLGWNGTLGQFT